MMSALGWYVVHPEINYQRSAAVSTAKSPARGHAPTRPGTGTQPLPAVEEEDKQERVRVEDRNVSSRGSEFGEEGFVPCRRSEA